MQRSYLQLDVFASAPGRGNPLAVVLDATDLDGAGMQRIAAWLNLSETTFVLPATRPGADYRLRIFTPRQELPFAGHPSVGTAHAVLERELVAPRGVERAADAAPILASLGGVPLGRLRPAVIDNGPRWWCVELADEASVRALAVDLPAMARANRATDTVGVAVFARCLGQSYALVVRAFVPADGIPEDPVTGSANAAITGWLQSNQALPARRFLSSQGREIGRDGLVECAVDSDEEVWIGGQTQTVVAGVMHW